MRLRPWPLEDRPKEGPMHVTIISLSTRNYEFMAVGNGLHEAEVQMRATLTKHAEQTGADLDYLLWFLENDASVVQVKTPAGLRDGEVL